LRWQVTWLAIIKRVQVCADDGTRLAPNQEAELHLLTSAGKCCHHHHCRHLQPAATTAKLCHATRDDIIYDVSWCEVVHSSLSSVLLPPNFAYSPLRKPWWRVMGSSSHFATNKVANKISLGENYVLPDDGSLTGTYRQCSHLANASAAGRTGTLTSGFDFNIGFPISVP